MYAPKRHKNSQADRLANIERQNKQILELFTPMSAFYLKTVQNVCLAENHYLMHVLKNEAPLGYKAMQNALKCGLVVFDHAKNAFNFCMDKGCVGLIFADAGYTEYKTIARYILLNGKPCKLITLQNAVKNTPPKSWQGIEKILYAKN
jgi:hypothetical protein